MKRNRTKVIRRLVQSGANCSDRSYWQAAGERLTAARFLANNSEYRLDAIYLGGYAVECALKALILRRTPKSRWAAVCEEIGSGSRAHNMEFLAGVLRRKQCVLPAEILDGLATVSHEWTTDLRYIGARVPPKEAETFVETASLIYSWVERSM